MDLIEAYNAGNLFGKENNLHLNIISEGHIEYTMQLEDKHMALHNVVHGGAIAGLMDALLSIAAFSLVAKDNKHVATSEFKINYLKAIRNKCIIKGVGKVIKSGNRLIVCEGEIFNDKGEAIAKAMGTIIPFENKQ